MASRALWQNKLDDRFEHDADGSLDEELRRGKARKIVRDKLTSIPGMIQFLDEN